MNYFELFFIGLEIIYVYDYCRSTEILLHIVLHLYYINVWILLYFSKILFKFRITYEICQVYYVNEEKILECNRIILGVPSYYNAIRHFYSTLDLSKLFFATVS